MDNMCYNYHSRTEDYNSLKKLISEARLECWQASCAELKDLEGVNSEALWQVMQWRLDEDMVLEMCQIDRDNSHK